jgi:hypothetical protein
MIAMSGRRPSLDEVGGAGDEDLVARDPHEVDERAALLVVGELHRQRRRAGDRLAERVLVVERRVEARDHADGEPIEREVLAALDRDHAVRGDAARERDLRGGLATEDLRAAGERDPGGVEQMIHVRVTDHDQVRALRRVLRDRRGIGDDHVVELGPREVGIDEDRGLAALDLPARDPEVGEGEWSFRSGRRDLRRRRSGAGEQQQQAKRTHAPATRHRAELFS